ncbi:MAG TPA: ABC transporter permease [Baekduia sp.]|uniref:ABC transporter permease n=1 Tax=Baekduia sp. TaxID=2600305 RepID=UPI002D78454B|nr:ABC transporter permease [Baekduia sp.]HET6508333.1 ABC transporter permease [Baekduia sp.]
MLAALIIIVLLGIWELYARLGSVDDFILPAPDQVASSLWHDRGLLWDNLLVTAEEMLLGLLVALVAGAALALLLHRFAPVRKALYPLLVGTQAIPIVTIAPLLAAWFGYGLLPKLVIVALVCFFPIVVTTLDGLRSVDPEQHKLMRTLNATPAQTLRWVELPTALPAALSGAKIAVAVGGIAAVFAEYAGSEDGLGHLLLQSIPQLETARAWAAVVVLAALAVFCFALLALAERRLAPWAHRPKDPTT